MKKTRIIIDVSMFVLYIILMGHHITTNLIHEILGTILFLLFIAHNIINIKWYKSIFKGKHTFQRNFQIVSNLLLLVAMIGMIVSGIMISSDVFSFLNIPTTILGRRLHMLSTAWGYLLISIHLGLHLKMMLNKLNNKMKKSTFEYIYYFILVMVALFGLYSFVNLGILKDMFLVTEFKFYNYEEMPILFYLKTTCGMLFISLIIYLIDFNITKVKNKNFSKNGGKNE